MSQLIVGVQVRVIVCTIFLHVMFIPQLLMRVLFTKKLQKLQYHQHLIQIIVTTLKYQDNVDCE